MLTSADRSVWRLVPYQGRVFTIVGLEEFRVEFERDAADAVDAFIFHQPSGTVRAHRVAE